MNIMQDQVMEFYRKMGKEPSETLQTELIREECYELLGAVRDRDTVDILDGICDLLYVTLGLANALGVDIEPFFNEVHKTNLAKIGPKGPKFRSDGKLLKPVNWIPPDLQRILKEQEQIHGPN